MNVLFIARATLYTVYGGDTVQIQSTAKYLRKLGVHVDIKLCNEIIDYTAYDLLHLFNATRPADLLPHIRKSNKPYVVSTIFVDFSEYESMHRSRLMSLLNRMFSADGVEYIKAMARWAKNGERINSLYYLLKGHKRSVQKVASGAAILLPNSESEFLRFVAKYNTPNKHRVIYNAVDTEVFNITDDEAASPRNQNEVICVSRIEGKKNQLNLIRALNNTPFQLTLIGAPAPNHVEYYNKCREIAAGNIRFIPFLPQKELIGHYLSAKVHVLSSWNETCGLSTMEAAFAGCNTVITDKGDTTEYFGDHAWYCDPGDPDSIYNAIKKASEAPVTTALREQINDSRNWHETAKQTLKAYEEALGRKIKQHVPVMDAV